MRTLILYLLAMMLFFSNCQAKVTRNKKQNVVLILIDDLSHYGVTAYGANRISSKDSLFTNVKINTPHIDKLAETGLLFDNAFAYPLCENTRVAFMSGKYNSRNYLRCKSQHASDITFGDVFKKAGYATGVFGKWKQTRGTKEIAGKDYIYEFGWDEFCCFDVTTEGQRYINPFLVINGEIKNYTGRKDVDPETGRRWYGPDICNRQALNFIEKNKDKPFFLYYPMLLVHDEHKPTPDTKPNSIFDEFDEANNNKNGHTGDDRTYFPDMISYTDKLIGKVVQKLDELGLRENTLIVVMGDNGTKECFVHIKPDGSIYPGRKGGTADNGLHVPLVFNQKGRIASANGNGFRTYNGLVDLTDIFPTICEAVGVEIPRKDELDGISFWPQVMGDTTEHRKVIYTWYNGNNLYTDSTELLKYAFNKSFKRYAPCTEYPNGRFFDLRTDPLEQAGKSYVERRWQLRLYSGLDINKLTSDQQKAYDKLGKVIEKYKYVAVQSLKIIAPKTNCRIGEVLHLSHQVLPENSTRKNIIWESSNPKLASINKFGELKALKKGKVRITIYSWDDAYPLSANAENTYKKMGIQSSVDISIR